MGRGKRGYPKSLALDRFWTTKHFGVLFVPPFGLCYGAVGIYHYRVATGFVVAEGDDGCAVTQVTEHGGDGSHPCIDPFPGRKRIQDIRAGIEQLHLNIQTGFSIPAFFFGIPHQKSFMLAQPCGGNFHNLRGHSEVYGKAKSHGGCYRLQYFLKHNVLRRCFSPVRLRAKDTR